MDIGEADIMFPFFSNEAPHFFRVIVDVVVRGCDCDCDAWDGNGGNSGEFVGKSVFPEGADVRGEVDAREEVGRSDFFSDVEGEGVKRGVNVAVGRVSGCGDGDARDDHGGGTHELAGDSVEAVVEKVLLTCERNAGEIRGFSLRPPKREASLDTR